jgi:glycine/D-amino acid oxidase-like deaminating enzyme
MRDAQAKTTPCVAVLGAGIRGAALTAFLAATKQFKILVVESGTPGCGISSTNHGRFHSGTWNYPLNPSAIIDRDRESFQLARRLPGIWETSEQGLYCIESKDCVRGFSERFPEATPVRAEDIHTSWISPGRYSIYEIPEHSFDPARLAARLVGFALNSGTTAMVNDRATRLERSERQFSVGLASGGTIQCDVVVNAMGGWLNSLQSELPLWRPNLAFHCWRLLCLDTVALSSSRLSRVITIDRLSDPSIPTPGPLGVVPHGRWVVFGCDIPALPMASQDHLPPRAGWRPFDSGDEMDSALFHHHQSHFPILKKARDSRALYSFPGVYPEPNSKETLDRTHTGKPTPYRESVGLSPAVRHESRHSCLSGPKSAGQ